MFPVILLAVGAAGAVLGALVGRWWLLLAVVPAGVVIWARGDLEGDLDAVVAIALSLTAAAGLALETALSRRRRGRAGGL